MIFRKWLISDNNDISVMEEKYFTDPWSVAMLDASVKGNGFVGYVAVENDKICGYIGADYCFEVADILLVAVDENFRRKGVATKLFEKVETELKENDVERIMLEVRKSNFAAQNCYAKLGFKVIAVREKYYQYTEDALIMEKKIK